MANSHAPRALILLMALQFGIGGSIIPFVSVLLRDQGLTFAQISHIFFVSSSTLLVFPFLWGMAADRFIPLNRLFTLLNVLTLGTLFFFSRQTTFTGALVSFTLLYMFFNPTLMLMNPLSFQHLDNPREQFGPLRAWGSFGWIVPSLPIFVWLAVQGEGEGSLKFTVYLAMGIALAAALTTFWLPHSPPGAASGSAETKLPYWEAIRRLFRNTNYLVILGSFFLIAGSFSILVLYSPPFLVERGMPRSWIGPVQCLGVLVEIILFRWRSLFVHKLSYRTTILFGCVALFIRQSLYAFSDHLGLLILSYALAGMVIVFYHIGASILVNTLASVEVRSTAQTLLVFFGSGMGPMFANWVAKELTEWRPGDLRPVFLFSAVLAALAAVLIAWRGKKLDQREGEAL